MNPPTTDLDTLRAHVVCLRDTHSPEEMGRKLNETDPDEGVDMIMRLQSPKGKLTPEELCRIRDLFCELMGASPTTPTMNKVDETTEEEDAEKKKRREAVDAIIEKNKKDEEETQAILALELSRDMVIERIQDFSRGNHVTHTVQEWAYVRKFMIQEKHEGTKIRRWARLIRPTGESAMESALRRLLDKGRSMDADNAALFFKWFNEAYPAPFSRKRAHSPSPTSAAKVKKLTHTKKVAIAEPPVSAAAPVTPAAAPMDVQTATMLLNGGYVKPPASGKSYHDSLIEMYDQTKTVVKETTVPVAPAKMKQKLHKVDAGKAPLHLLGSPDKKKSKTSDDAYLALFINNQTTDTRNMAEIREHLLESGKGKSWAMEGGNLHEEELLTKLDEYKQWVETNIAAGTSPNSSRSYHGLIFYTGVGTASKQDIIVGGVSLKTFMDELSKTTLDSATFILDLDTQDKELPTFRYPPGVSVYMAQTLGTPRKSLMHHVRHQLKSNRTVPSLCRESMNQWARDNRSDQFLPYYEDSVDVRRSL